MGYLLCNDHHHGYVKFHCISVQPWQRDGNHNLVKWPKDVSLGYLVRERFVCKEEAELMFSVPTPKGFLNWHESNVINEVEVRGYANGCTNPFVVTFYDKAASTRETRDHEL